MYEHESPHKVKLGDDYQYPIKWRGVALYKVDSGKYLNIKDVLYVPVLKKNIMSFSALDANGMTVSFVYNQVIMWHKGKTIDDATMIGEKD